MRISFILIVFSLLVFSCKPEKASEKVEAVSNSELIMYDPSEMTLLMEKMFEENERLKKKIENGEEIGEFNKEFLNIHSAELTKPKDRNDTFEAFSNALLVNQRAVFNTDSIHVKMKFNDMVKTCIACHKTNCTGVIPRIEKLIIK